MNFQFEVPLVKSWRDDQGRMWVQGVASSTRLDKQKERFSPSGLASMLAYEGCDLTGDHAGGFSAELGTVRKLHIDNNLFRIEAQLNSSSEAARLYRGLQEGRPYGLSVGGAVTKAFHEWDSNLGQNIKVIDGAKLEHIAVTRPGSQANPDSYLAIMAKSCDDLLTKRVRQPAHWRGQVRNPDAGLAKRAKDDGGFPPRVVFGPGAAAPPGSLLLRKEATAEGVTIYKRVTLDELGEGDEMEFDADALSKDHPLRKLSELGDLQKASGGGEVSVPLASVQTPAPPPPDAMMQLRAEGVPEAALAYYSSLLGFMQQGGYGPDRPSPPRDVPYQLIQRIQGLVLEYIKSQRQGKGVA